MRVAGEQVKPVALELGGKAPAVVFHDADLDLAARFISFAALVNAGQVCNSCSRVVVDRRIAEALQAKLSERFAATRLGAPLTDPDMGPVNSARQFEKIEGAIRTAEREGAEVLRLATLPAEPELRQGYFVQPTLLGSVTPAQTAFREEIFGPVLTLTTFDDVDEAVSLANATEYGLNAGIFTKDVGTAMNVAHRVEAGQVYINGWGTGGGVEVPFGGFKKSGFSREKGFEGLKHYLQVKAISVHFQ
jgi:acyl-CoA reductase-like NAD-dependent aldehyde dehydrogenase